MIRTVQALALLSLVSVVGCGASDATYQKTLKEITTLEKVISDKRIESFQASKKGDEAGYDQCMKEVQKTMGELQSLIDIAKRISPRRPDAAKWAEATKEFDELTRKISSLYEEQSSAILRDDYDRAIDIEKQVWDLTVEQDKACSIMWVADPKP